MLTIESPLAAESLDHKVPWGTKHSFNPVNPRFNHKLWKLFNGKSFRALDLGCGDGLFVMSLVDDGNDAYGIEGSDYSKKLCRSGWRYIPERLFTGDITKRIEVEPCELVTAWEVLEHIEPWDLDSVLDNVERNLTKNGLFMASISTRDEWVEGVNLHRTVRNKTWWEQKLASRFSPQPRLVAYFNTQFPGGRKRDPASFVFIGMKGRGEMVAPDEGMAHWIYDRWLGSNLQRFVAGTL